MLRLPKCKQRNLFKNGFLLLSSATVEFRSETEEKDEPRNGNEKKQVNGSNLISAASGKKMDYNNESTGLE